MDGQQPACNSLFVGGTPLFLFGFLLCNTLHYIFYNKVQDLVPRLLVTNMLNIDLIIFTRYAGL